MRANNPSDIVAGLKRCADELSRWNRIVFGHLPRQIQKKRNVLNDLVSRDQNGRNGTRSERRLMSCWIVKKLCGNKDQKCSGWVLEIAIQNNSILKLLGGKRKTQSPDCWMIWGSGERLLWTWQKLPCLILRSFIQLLIRIEFRRLLMLWNQRCLLR